MLRGRSAAVTAPSSHRSTIRVNIAMSMAKPRLVFSWEVNAFAACWGSLPKFTRRTRTGNTEHGTPHDGAHSWATQTCLCVRPGADYGTERVPVVDEEARIPPNPIPEDP